MRSVGGSPPTPVELQQGYGKVRLRTRSHPSRLRKATIQPQSVGTRMQNRRFPGVLPWRRGESKPVKPRTGTYSARWMQENSRVRGAATSGLCMECIQCTRVRDTPRDTPVVVVGARRASSASDGAMRRRKEARHATRRTSFGVQGLLRPLDRALLNGVRPRPASSDARRSTAPRGVTTRELAHPMPPLHHSAAEATRAG